MFGFDPFSRSSWCSVKTTIGKRVVSTSRRIRLVLMLTLLFIVFSIVTIGAPGYYLYAIGNGIAELISGPEILGSIHGDYYWPIQTWMGILWPVGACIVWCAMLLHNRDEPWSFKKYLLFLSVLLVYDVALSVVFRLGAALLS